MTAFAETTLIVLGAGLSSRFGSDKLVFALQGKPVATHLLAAIGPLHFAQKLLIARGQPWTRHFAEAALEVIHNSTPEVGQSSSLRLALSRSLARNILVMLADMPFVSTAHLQAIEDAFMRNEGGVVASTSADQCGPPAMFGRSILEKASLVGDHGARALLKQARTVSADVKEMYDIDYPADLLDIGAR